MELTNVAVVRVLPTQEVGDTFRKREIHVQTQEQYPQTLCVEFVQDKCSLLDNIGKGQTVTIGINLRGREWTNPQGEIKVFNQIQGWKISVSDQSGTQPTPNKEAFEPATSYKEEEHDDLPF